MGNRVSTLAFLPLCVAAHAQVIDYQNILNIGPSFPAGLEIADDIHRVSSADIVAIDFAYLGADIPGVEFRLRFYENLGTDVLPPPLIAEYTLAGLPGDRATNYVHFELPAPLPAPQDLWVGLLGTNFAAVEFAYPPTIGASQNYFIRDLDFDGTAETLVDTSFLDDFYLVIYTVPEPGTAVALLAFAIMGTSLGRGRQS